MNRIFILAAILFLGSWNVAFATCSLTPMTSYYPGKPGVFLYGPIKFSISCNEGEDISGTWTARTYSIYYGDVGSVTGSGSVVTMALPPLAGQYGVDVNGSHFYAGSDQFGIGKPPAGTPGVSFESCSPASGNNESTFNAVLKLNGLTNADAGQPLIYKSEVISSPPGSEASIGSGGSNINSYSLHVTKPGNYVVELWAEGYPYNIPSPKTTHQVTLSEENCGGYNFGLERFSLAQSVFLEKDTNDQKIPLVQGKPLMARVQVKSIKEIAEDDETMIGVSAFLFNDGADPQDPFPPKLELVGCFKAKKIREVINEGDSCSAEGGADPCVDTNDKIWVNLFQKSGSENTLPVNTGNITVTVNPLGGVNQIPEGLDCGESSVAWAPEAIRSNNSGNENYKVYDGLSSLSLGFVEVLPCLSRLDGCFNPVPNFEEFVDRATLLVGDTFPIADGQVTKHISVLAKVPAFFTGKNPSLTQDEREEAIANDALAVKMVGRLADIVNLRWSDRYIGVVSSNYNADKTAARGYFRWADPNYDTWGVFFDSVPRVILTHSMGAPTAVHELGHSFFMNFPFNSEDHSHQVDSLEVLANGFWVRQREGGLRLSKTPFTTAQSSLDEVLPWPIEASWMDNETYKGLHSWAVHRSRLKNKALTKRLEMDSITINGVISSEGKLSSVKGYSLPDMIYEEESEADRGSIEIRDPAGNILMTSKFPYSPYVTLDRSSGTQKVLSNFVPATISFPEISNVNEVVFKVDGIQKAVVNPYIAILDTAVDSIPDAAFKGNSGEQRASLKVVLQKVKTALTLKQFNTAKEKANELNSVASALLRDDFVKGNALEFGRSELVRALVRVTERIDELRQNFPAQDEHPLFKIEKNKQVYSVGERARIIVKASHVPENSQMEYWLGAFVDNVPQSVSSANAQRSRFVIDTQELAVGSRAFLVRVYLQNRQVIQALQQSIGSYSKELAVIVADLARESSPERIEALQQRKRELEAAIVDVRARIAENRTEISIPLTSEILVTE